MGSARCQRHTIGETERALVPHRTGAVGSEFQYFTVYLPESATLAHVQIPRRRQIQRNSGY
jgi:hypothetical protein